MKTKNGCYRISLIMRAVGQRDPVTGLMGMGHQATEITIPAQVDVLTLFGVI